MSLGFLLGKKYHPSSLSNQKKVWVAQEQEKHLLRHQQELKRQREIELAKEKTLSGNDSAFSSISFMYPQMQKKGETGEEEAKQEEQNKETKEITYKEEKKDALKPWMAIAPKEGKFADDVDFVPKPFGIEVKRVKCARCGIWGHRSGDKECELKDVNPNDDFRRILEDPLTSMQLRNSLNDDKFVLKDSLRDGRQLGGNKAYEILQENEEENNDELEKQFLANLNKKDRKMLLKFLTKEEKKTSKRDRNTKIGDNSDESSDSSSDGESRREKKKRKKHKSDKHRHRHKHRKHKKEK